MSTPGAPNSCMNSSAYFLSRTNATNISPSADITPHITLPIENTSFVTNAFVNFSINDVSPEANRVFLSLRAIKQ